jgi:outer membrane biosynthesis protein TonB
LIPAALKAVLQWKYEPTLLNGVPVAVEMEVTVHFNFRN